MFGNDTRVIVLKIFRFSDKSRAVQVENVNRNSQPKIESVIYMYIMILYCLHTLPMTCELHISSALRSDMRHDIQRWFKSIYFFLQGNYSLNALNITPGCQ